MTETISIGIDVGTSTTKVVADNGIKFTFGSVVAKKRLKNGSVEYTVGKEALAKNIFKDTKIIWPVIKGRFVDNPEEASILIKYAINTVFEKLKIDESKRDYSKVNIALGVPYKALTDAEAIKEILKKNIGVGNIKVYFQALGTLEAEGKGTGMVVSLGQGTTEILVFYNGQIVIGESLKDALDEVLSILGPNKFLNHKYVQSNIIKFASKLEDYLDVVCNRTMEIKEGLQDDEIDEMPLYFMGGAVMLAPTKAHIERKISVPAIISDDIARNAVGLYNLAQKQIQVVSNQTPESQEASA